MSPIYFSADRFLIGTLISATAIATYTIPFEIVTQTLIIVGAIAGVAFASLSSIVHSQPEKSELLFLTWLKRVAAIMFIVVFLCALSLPMVLPWWIGSALPAESIYIGQILCVGIFFNSIGIMYYSLLHAYGRADLTAKLQLFQLPIYLSTLYLMITNFGPIGAAITWSGRCALDTILLRFAQKTSKKINATTND